MNNENIDKKLHAIFISTKTIFLVALTFLVIINTFVLVTLVPIVGYYLSLDTQAIGELWRIVILSIEILIVVIVLSPVVYGIVALIKTLNLESKNEKAESAKEISAIGETFYILVITGIVLIIIGSILLICGY